MTLYRQISCLALHIDFRAFINLNPELKKLLVISRICARGHTPGAPLEILFSVAREHSVIKMRTKDARRKIKSRGIRM